jgi:hypothetical protein
MGLQLSRAGWIMYESLMRKRNYPRPITIFFKDETFNELVRIAIEKGYDKTSRKVKKANVSKLIRDMVEKCVQEKLI